MWLRPLGKDPQAQQDVRRVALSAEAACMSFAHLLNLLLDARYLTLGGQSLQVCDPGRVFLPVCGRLGWAG
jgi:hypothetical protein